jgi:CheY-like chemotaxis protein
MTLTKILIGDDQFGKQSKMGERMRRDFELDYKSIFQNTTLTYTANPDEFVQLAKTGDYQVLMIDLNWEMDDYGRYNKTGYRVLDAVRDYAEKRILWTSQNKEAHEKAYQHGATHCIGKRPSPKKLEKIIQD